MNNRKDPEYTRHHGKQTAHLVDGDDDSDESIFVVTSLVSECRKTMVDMEIELNGKKLKAIVDTGATRTIMDESVVEQLQYPLTNYRGVPLKLADGGQLVPIGEFQSVIKASVDGVTAIVKMSILVCENLPFDVLLGNDFNCKAGVVVDCSNMRATLNAINQHLTNYGQKVTVNNWTTSVIENGNRRPTVITAMLMVSVLGLVIATFAVLSTVAVVHIAMVPLEKVAYQLDVNFTNNGTAWPGKTSMVPCDSIRNSCGARTLALVLSPRWTRDMFGQP